MRTEVHLHVALVEGFATAIPKSHGSYPATQLACQQYTVIVGTVADGAPPIERAAIWRLHRDVVDILLARAKGS